MEPVRIPLPMRVLLVDDHTLFRRALASLLSSRPGIDIVAEAGDGLEALAKARQTRPHVILMDIGLPHCSGLEATRRIKAELPDTQIVILTMSADDGDLVAALQNGAIGYLLKNLEPYQLFDMLEGLRRGEAPLSGAVAARLLARFAAPAGVDRPAEADEQLTPREIEVLQQLVTGASNQQIADALCITEHTVKLHMRNILDRLHVQNRVQAAVLAVHQGLVEVDPHGPAGPA